MNKLIIFLLPLLLLISCNTQKSSLRKAYAGLSKEDRKLADTMLLYALDHEALYTLANNMKPMSSVRSYRLPLNADTSDQRIKELYQLQKLTKAFSEGDFEFVLNPYKYTDSLYKNMEVYVFRKSSLHKMIRQHESFYLNLGINAEALPATVLAITEYGNKYERWQSYGHLFGYPDEAVNFFVNAGREQDSTLKFVERDFFAIPVHAAATGHFTYAIKKESEPSPKDSAIYHQAMQTLERYNIQRKKIIERKNKSPFRLWMKML